MQVAKLAGIPRHVLTAARNKLHELEQAGLAREQQSSAPMQGELLLMPVQESTVEELLAETDADSLTPRQALDLVYRLKGLLGKA